MKRTIFYLLFLLAFPSAILADSEPFEMTEGMAAFNNDDWKDAVEYLSAAVLKDPTLWKAYEYLGFAYYNQDAFDQALANWNKSLSLHPDNDHLNDCRAKLIEYLKTSATVSPVPTVPAPPTTPSSYPETSKILYAFAGFATPFDPAAFKSDYEPSYSLGGGAGIGFSKTFSLLLDANFNLFHLNPSAFPGADLNGGSISDITLLINGKFRFISDDNPVVPYGIVGIGISFYNAQPLYETTGGFPPTTTQVTTGLANNEFAFRLALGIDIKLKPGEYVFVESNGLGTSTGSENITYNILKVGIDFNLNQDQTLVSKNPPSITEDK